MTDNFVTFNIRHEKALFELKIKFPGDVSGFVERLKNELKFEETDELMILYPTPGGKMMEIQSDNDFEVLKKTKLAYNAVTKEIYCNVELVVTVILPDDTKAQIMILSKKIDKLASKINELSDKFTKIIDENKTSNCSNIRSILAEHFDLQFDSGSKSKNNSLNKFKFEKCEKSIDIKHPRKKSKENKKKMSSTARTNDNSSTEEDKPHNFDVLLNMLGRAVYQYYTETEHNSIEEI